MTTEAFICPSRTAAMFDAIAAEGESMKPHWLNRYGGYSDPIVGYTDGWWSKPIREVTLSETNPITYVDADGYGWQSDRHFKTDWGSVPRCVQLLPGYDRERYVGYLLHDSAYNVHDAANGHGLWRTKTVLETSVDASGMISFLPVQKFLAVRENFEFIRLDRGQVDAMLHDMILADGGRKGQANVIRAAVWACGWAAWKASG